MQFAHPRGFTRPLSHVEYFEEPLTLASGLANADVVLSGDGCHPLTNRGEIVLVRHPRAQTPGTFGKVKGKLVKAKSQSSIKSQRWHDPREQARTVAAAQRRDRLLGGMFYKAPPKVKLSDLEKAREAQIEARQRETLRAYLAARALA